MIEACVGSVTDAIVAQKAGAGRLELCSAFELGGLTPSLGLLQSVKAHTELPVVAMIRPRAGGFCYDPHELDAMRRDVETMLAHGADGIVFGCLRSDGSPDLEHANFLCELATESCTVFHRAFDFVPDSTQALEALIEIGVTRVLTSGCATSAEAGIPTLRKLHQSARGRIEILPAGGIRADNVQKICNATGCADAHSGVSEMHQDPVTSQTDSLNLVDTRCCEGNGFRRLSPTEFEAVVRAHGDGPVPTIL